MTNHLTEYLESCLTDFQTLVTRDPSPENVAIKTKNLLTQLFDDYSKTVELGLLQRRIYPFVRNLSHAVTDTFPTLTVVPKNPEPTNKSNRPSFLKLGEPIEFALQLLPPAILILAFLFSTNLIVVLLGVIWLLSVIITYRRRSCANHQPKTSEVKIDVDKISATLKTIASDADRLMKEAGEIDEQKNKKRGFWNDNPDILDLLHDLTEISKTDDTEYAMKKLRVIPAILKAKGLTLVSYDGENKDWFDFYPSLDATYRDSETIKPALLKNENLVRRGIVIQPAKH